MPLVINTNVSSLNAQRHLQASRNDLETAMERLSSGKRINSAMEDAAGLTIAHSLETKVKSRNCRS
jgi:flagellin